MTDSKTIIPAAPGFSVLLLSIISEGTDSEYLSTHLHPIIAWQMRADADPVPVTVWGDCSDPGYQIVTPDKQVMSKAHGGPVDLAEYIDCGDAWHHVLETRKREKARYEAKHTAKAQTADEARS
jgi:hypothetical protein